MEEHTKLITVWDGGGNSYKPTAGEVSFRLSAGRRGFRGSKQVLVEREETEAVARRGRW